MNFEKKLFMNSFFNVKFNYRPLIWILPSCTNNNVIRHLHERCLKLYMVKNNYLMMNFWKGSVSIHQKLCKVWQLRHLKLRMKCLRKCVRNQHNFLGIPFVNTVHNGTESISYLDSKILNIVPDEIKQKPSLSSFKESI